MSEDRTSQARFQLSTGQMIGVAILMGLAGGLCTLAAGAVTRSVLVVPFRQQLEQMDAPPGGAAEPGQDRGHRRPGRVARRAARQPDAAAVSRTGQAWARMMPAITLACYEIRVAGVLPPEALPAFQRRRARSAAETQLRGPLPDQGALPALLTRLEELGVQVLEVRRLRAGPAG